MPRPIAYRFNKKPLLFFKTVETDTLGRAQIDFSTSDRLTTYRVMAVAYNRTGSGSGETSLQVSKKIVVSEAIPEFAVRKDSFTAGLRVDNRTDRALPASVSIKGDNITVTGPKTQSVTIPAKGSKTVAAGFQVQHTGQAKVYFSAQSKELQDGIVKTIPLLDNRARHALLF
ncbi:MAG: hypothetical protein GY765_22095, partial [bacterium]|nr:hypothetical protein [bacterium]